VFDEELAALVAGEAFFEADFAAFDVAEDLFQLGECFLERLGRRLDFLGHRCSILELMPGTIEPSSPTVRRRSTLTLAAALLIAAVMIGLTIGHVHGVNGPWYWTWPWRRLNAWSLYPVMALASAPFFLAQWIYHRRPIEARRAVFLLMLATFCLQLAAIGQQPLGIRRVAELVENPNITSYYSAAKVFVNQQRQGVAMSDWLQLYPDLLQFMRVHARFKPPGLVLFYVAIIHLFGEGTVGAMVGGVLIGAGSTLAIPATHRLIRTLGRDEHAAFCGASFIALCPSLVLFLPQYDQLYPALAVLLLLGWVASLRVGSDARAVGFGLLLTLATFMSYLLLVVGFSMAVYTILYIAREGRSGLLKTLRAAILAIATICACYFFLWVCLGFDPIATFRSITYLQEKDLIHLSRPWPLHIIWDLYDFALGSGWISYVLAGTLMLFGLRTLTSEARSLVLIGLSQIAVVAAASFLPGESARLWMPLLPFLMPATGFELARRPVGHRIAVYTALLVITCAVGQNMIFLNLGEIDRPTQDLTLAPDRSPAVAAAAAKPG
jgi:hypothetical protein